MQLVKAVMNQGVVSMDVASSVFDAARKMRDQDIGFLCLTKSGKELAGCVTDRDLVLGPIASGRGGQTRLSEFMERKLATVSPDATIDDAVYTMQAHKTQRLLVVDEKHNPIGVVALADLAGKCENKKLILELLTDIKQPH